MVVGGGCFGAHHVRHLEKGRKRGRISADARIIMVDHNERPSSLDAPEVGGNPHLTHVRSDWLDYMKANWDRLPSHTQIVPAPVAPHLAFEWLVWSLQVRLGDKAVSTIPMLPEFGGLPYEYLAPSGDRYISAAGWICPTNCRAPHICPMTRDVRFWDLEETVRNFAAEHPDKIASAVVFKPQFRVPGVDVIRLGEYTSERDRLLALMRSCSPGMQVVVGTVSPCHGAVSLMEFSGQEVKRER